MNRRNFIETLLGAAAAAVAPSVTVADAPIDLTGFLAIWANLPLKFEKEKGEYVRVHPFQQIGSHYYPSVRYAAAPFTWVNHFNPKTSEWIGVIYDSKKAEAMFLEALSKIK